MLITFTQQEIVLAHVVAGQRMAQNFMRNVQERNGSNLNAWWPHIVGCLGELALAKALDRYWTAGVGSYKAPDVGNLQVRSVITPTGRLRLHPEDRDDDVFYLVRINKMTAHVVGWIRARDGKRPEYWETLQSRPEHPAFFVPTDKLNACETGY